MRLMYINEQPAKKLAVYWYTWVFFYAGNE